jgi:hypothetical protein
MSGPDEIGDTELWCALNELASRYWYDVDFNGGRTAHERYTADGLFAVGTNRFSGRDSIKAFYEWRRGRGATSTRHLITNAQVLARDGNRARWFGVLTVYRGSGRAPFKASEPALLADVMAECVIGDDRVWRYASHVIEPVFVGSDVPLSLSIDPNHLAASKAAQGA